MSWTINATSNWTNNSVTGGIGLSSWVNYSAGDYILNNQDQTGINRSARVEIYII